MQLRYHVVMEKDQKDSIFRAVELTLIEKNDKERERFGGEIEKILTFVSDVQSIETNEKPGTSGRINVFREDKVTVESGKYREEMLTQAPNRFKQYFLSKKIL